MKVIQILPELHGGGIERGTLELGKYLAEHGHQSVVISNGGRLVSRLEAEGTRHINLPVHRKSPMSLRHVGSLRKIFEQESPDVVHLRSRLPAWLGWLAWRTIPSAIRPRLITTVHGFYSVNGYSRIMTCGERVICVSESIKKYVLQNYPSVPESKLTVIHRGIDTAEYSFDYRPTAAWLAKWREQYPQLAGKYVVTLPGRITRWKGQLDFVEIVKQLKARGLPVCGLVVGESHDCKQNFEVEVRHCVKQAGLERDMIFTGYRSDLRDVMAVSDVVVSCSTDPEAFGRVTLEAICLGKPVAAYAHGGVDEQLAELFPEGRIPLGDIPAMIDILTTWYTDRPQPARNDTHPFTLQNFQAASLAVYESNHFSSRAA